jgi:hypothetical protein
MAKPGAGFDPIKFKESTRKQWENVAEAWNHWGPTLQRWLEPATADTPNDQGSEMTAPSGPSR